MFFSFLLSLPLILFLVQRASMAVLGCFWLVWMFSVTGFRCTAFERKVAVDFALSGKVANFGKTCHDVCSSVVASSSYSRLFYFFLLVEMQTQLPYNVAAISDSFFPLISNRLFEKQVIIHSRLQWAFCVFTGLKTPGQAAVDSSWGERHSAQTSACVFILNPRIPEWWRFIQRYWPFRNIYHVMQLSHYGFGPLIFLCSVSVGQ